MSTLQVSGLDDVVFAETVLSQVDGEAGRLVMRGYDVETLSGHVSFLEALHLLWWGRLPHHSEMLEVRQRLGLKRVQVFTRLIALPEGPRSSMDYLRYALASLEGDGSDLWDEALTLCAATAVATAIWMRRQEKRPPVRPDAALDHGEDILHMFADAPVDPARAMALESYLVTVMDHGMNASTFTARVVASTGSDLTSAVVAALGALKGPLHGGAPGPVLDMLAAVGEPARARAWLEAELEAGRRIMGMGHRIYRVRDPRAAVLEKALDRLEQTGVKTPRLALARAVEKAAAELLQERYPQRPLKANVEFYTAVLLDAIGLPAEVFSACFAIGRVVGWCAHVDEQRRHGRLVRPQSRYVGPDPAPLDAIPARPAIRR
ncbi:MAG TPA: citrate synthase [Oligoflexus sp.]|uniref:citrate synthase n=1 Tax=Oligoflexus sp. TaxID=1971216 RepID=UPI002D7F643A|nr:citrate synthase [Oligoflexus sp.]HET9239121.1 citrate synthase [Oligoflexus sp.]